MTHDGDRGSAVLLTFTITSTLLALGLGLVAVSTTERAIGGNHHAGVQALYAAEAVAAYVVAELASDASWGPALTGERHSAFLETTTMPLAPWKEQLDLSAMTARLQQQSDTEWSAGLDTPQWRVFAAGSFEALVGSGSVGQMFLTAWVADDWADGDASPGVDGNGAVMVRAQALGMGGLQRSVLIGLARNEDGLVTVLNWRELR